MNNSTTTLKNPLTDQETKVNTVKLQQIQDVLNKTKKNIIQKNIQTVISQKQKMIKFTQSLNKIKGKIQLHETQCAKGINDIKLQISDLQKKVYNYELQTKTRNKEKQYQDQIQKLQKEYLKLWQKRISISNSVNVKAFYEIQIQDRKSKAHQIFKWIVLAIYGQPETKYYWPNFQGQIFKKDEGADFKVRLGKVNSSSAKQEQIVKTEELLKMFKQCQSCPQLSSVSSQIEKIRQVTQIYKQCYQLAKKIKDLQKSIQKSKQESIQKDEESMKWRARIEALKDRMVTNEKYSKILKTMMAKIQNKNSQYAEKQHKFIQILQKTKQFEGITQLVTNIGQQQNGYCQCRIY